MLQGSMSSTQQIQFLGEFLVHRHFLKPTIFESGALKLKGFFSNTFQLLLIEWKRNRFKTTVQLIKLIKLKKNYGTPLKEES